MREGRTPCPKNKRMTVTVRDEGDQKVRNSNSRALTGRLATISSDLPIRQAVDGCPHGYQGTNWQLIKSGYIRYLASFAAKSPPSKVIRLWSTVELWVSLHFKFNVE
jgi:hypothetical protein